MRALVSGGRSFSDRGMVFHALDQVHKDDERGPITTIIEGGCTGTDTHASDWALSRNVAVETFPANWEKYGKAAGPIRNEEMFALGKPDIAVFFPGGAGTASAKRIARENRVDSLEYHYGGVNIWRYAEESEGSSA